MAQVRFKMRHDSGSEHFHIYDNCNHPWDLTSCIGINVCMYAEGFALGIDISDSMTTIKFRKSRRLRMLKANNYIIIDDERMLLTSDVDMETSEATVERAQGTTTAAKHSSGSSVTLIKFEDLNEGRAYFTDANNQRRGIVNVEFASEDLDSVGNYKLEFEFIFPGESLGEEVKRTFPTAKNGIYYPIVSVGKDGNHA